jgi:hypothetical protein
MTEQESFKRRIRERMARTGERYSAARRTLIEKSDGKAAGRTWVSQPELTDESVRAGTGRGWDEWCDVIDAWHGRGDGHTAIASWLQNEHGVDSWWSQSVTVGYERITGLRLKHQQPDGTFAAGRSRTVVVDPRALREMLLDDDGRADLFPGTPTDLRSKPGAKQLRIGIGGGVAQIAMDPQKDGRVKVTVQHEKLATPGEVEEWKQFWGAWLEALEDD